eukprot:CAMPEP_0181385724 /NCGR_PEP_ID=MMETSP1106-20121128/22722_1 /TAXON_ID=81844 /ORGANISM="Mantoniella antarctica, Strain SL-175" /LENGTH=205 /DNA_ID=CAMNT_0023505823 /DNA_START=401 /DNA_END=1018 /DNA_ORIENTATION=-
MAMPRGYALDGDFRWETPGLQTSMGALVSAPASTSARISSRVSARARTSRSGLSSVAAAAASDAAAAAVAAASVAAAAPPACITLSIQLASTSTLPVLSPLLSLPSSSSYGSRTAAGSFNFAAAGKLRNKASSVALSVDAGGDRASVDGTREPTVLAPPGPTLDGGGEPGDGGHHAGSSATTSHAVHRPSSAATAMASTGVPGAQ